MKRILLPTSFWGIFLAFWACKTAKPAANVRQLQKGHVIFDTLSQTPAHAGCLFVEADSWKVLFERNSEKWFTPASNTKILTLASCLRWLPDTLPAAEYRYEKNEDGVPELHFRGTGDPTFLHPDFEHWQSFFQFLKKSNERLVMLRNEDGEPRFGPGWCWDDYNHYYQVEKSAFPVMGNCIAVKNNGGKIEIHPTRFREQFFYPVMAKNVVEVERLETENLWGMNRPPAVGTTIVLPIFRPAANELLSDTLHKTVDLQKNEHDDLPWTTFRSCPRDTVLRLMMHRSDNFCAEQLLMMCARQHSGSLKTTPFLEWQRDSAWQLPQKMRWVDGSGLSRYNLNSPKNLVAILHQLWKSNNQSYLWSFFPAGGLQGTLKNHFAGEKGVPYVFAKSGSMSGVYCLSGYLRTKSNKVLIFSIMINHFTGSHQPVKSRVQQMLEWARDTF